MKTISLRKSFHKAFFAKKLLPNAVKGVDGKPTVPYHDCIGFVWTCSATFIQKYCNRWHKTQFFVMLPYRVRWLTSAEKACLMGYPILESTAAAYGCHPLAWDQLTDPHANLGNSMHVPNAGGVILATLLSIQLHQPYCIYSHVL